VLHDGYNGSPELQTEIQRFVKSSTAPYKYPRKIEFIAELPKTITGKVKRKDLRDMDARSVAEMIA